MSSDPSAIRVEHELFMRSFFGIPPPRRVTRQMVASVRDLYFDPGEVVFRAHEPTRMVFFVVEGDVTMSTADEDEDAWTFGPMSLIGIVDANLNRPHARTARAKTELHVLAIRVEDFYDILEDNFDFARAMLLDAMSATWERSLQLDASNVFPHDPSRRPERPWRSVRKLNPVQRLMVLRGSTFMESAPVQPLVVLCSQTVEQRVQAGQVFLEAGEGLDKLWVVADGHLQIREETGMDGLSALQSRWAAQVAAVRSNTTDLIAGDFGPGEIVLATAALPAPTSPLRVTAASDAVVLGVPKEALWDMMEDHFGLFRCALAYTSLENERIRLERAFRAAAGEWEWTG